LTVTCEQMVPTEIPSNPMGKKSQIRTLQPHSRALETSSSNPVVLTLYMENIPEVVVESQARVVKSFLPEGCDFFQITASDHAAGLDAFLTQYRRDAYVILDVDCIPLVPWVLPWLLHNALAGILIGCAQRASHIENDSHIYAGPFAVAFGRELFESLGCVSFASTPRGDVGEELTYRCEEAGIPISLLWPTDVTVPLWDLRAGRPFGEGTTYGGVLYHAFAIRDQRTCPIFLKKCEAVLRDFDSSELKAVPLPSDWTPLSVAHEKNRHDGRQLQP
jgi:hypothetical protein